MTGPRRSTSGVRAIQGRSVGAFYRALALVRSESDRYTDRASNAGLLLSRMTSPGIMRANRDELDAAFGLVELGGTGLDLSTGDLYLKGANQDTWGVPILNLQSLGGAGRVLLSYHVDAEEVTAFFSREGVTTQAVIARKPSGEAEAFLQHPDGSLTPAVKFRTAEGQIILRYP